MTKQVQVAKPTPSCTEVPPTRKKLKVKNKLGPFRAWVRLATLGQVGTPNLRDVAALYRQARTEGHENIAQAQALSRAAADAKDLASSEGQASYFLGQKSKDFYRVRDRKVATEFKASLPEGTDVDKALSIIRHHKASPTCMGAAVALAKSLIRLDSAERQDKLKLQKQRLEEYNAAVGTAEVKRYQGLLPCLKDVSWKSVPSMAVPVLELSPSETQRKAMAVCSAICGTQTPLAGAMDKFWEEQHYTIDKGLDMKQRGQAEEKTHTECLESGVCLCSAEGQALKRLHRAFLAKMKGAFQLQDMKSLLANGQICVRLTERGQDMPATGNRGRRPDIFLHVAMMYWSPYRPTFLLMEQVAAGGQQREGEFWLQACTKSQ